MLGDGWVDALNQVNFYDSYLWSAGIADRNVRDLCSWYQTNAMINIQNGNYEKVQFYFIKRLLNIFQFLITMQLSLKSISETFQFSTSKSMMNLWTLLMFL